MRVDELAARVCGEHRPDGGDQSVRATACFVNYCQTNIGQTSECVAVIVTRQRQDAAFVLKFDAARGVANQRRGITCPAPHKWSNCNSARRGSSCEACLIPGL